MYFIQNVDTEDSSSDSDHQDRNYQIRKDMTIYAIQKYMHMDQLFQELWVTIFNKFLLFSQSFDDLKASIQQIVEQLSGEKFKNRDIQIQNQYYCKYKGMTIFQINYSQEFKKEIEKLIVKFRDATPMSFDQMFQIIFRELAKCPTLHFIMKQFLLVHKNILDEYYKSHLEEIQKINFMRQNSTQKIKTNNIVQCEILEIQKKDKINLFSESFRAQQQQILFKEVQKFIQAKQSYFKLKATYFYRRNFIEIIKKIEGMFLAATQTDQKKRQINMLQLLKFRGQKISTPLIVMNILNSQSKYFREYLKLFITYDNIQKLTYQIKDRLKNLIKILTKKQDLINYLSSSHQQIYKSQKQFKFYHRVVVINDLYKFCAKLKFDIDQRLVWKSIQLFDQYMLRKKLIVGQKLCKPIIKIFYIVIKNYTPLNDPQNLDLMKQAAGFTIKAQQIAQMEIILKNMSNFPQSDKIDFSLQNMIIRLIQKYFQQKDNWEIEALNKLIRAVLMDECIFMFDQSVISYSIYLIIIFRNQIQSLSFIEVQDKKIDQMLFETMKQEKIDMKTIKKVKQCFEYIRCKKFLYICSCKNKYNNVNSLIHHKQLVRLVLNNQSEKRLNF